MKPFHVLTATALALASLAASAQEINFGIIATDSASVERERWEPLFRDMEKALANGPWLCGDAFTLADIGFISFFSRMGAMESAGIWRAHYPRVADWYERCKARPSFGIAITGYIPEARAAHFTRVSAPLRTKVEAAFAQAMTIA